MSKNKICIVNNCCNKHYCKGYCRKHYYQYTRYGRILERTKTDPNEIIEYDTYAEIVLYNNNNEEIARTIIDIDDVEKCKDLKWSLDNKGYVINSKNKIKLHRFIMDCPNDLVIDHINHKTLDNRKSNLRICTKQENVWNSNVYSNNKSGCKGVFKQDNKYIANYARIYLGTFDTYEEAKNAYEEKAKEIQGEFYIDYYNDLDDDFYDRY